MNTEQLIAIAENSIKNAVKLTADEIKEITTTLEQYVDDIIDLNNDEPEADTIVMCHTLIHALLVSEVFREYDESNPQIDPYVAPKYCKILSAWYLLEYCEGEWPYWRYYSPIAIGADGEEHEAKWELADKYLCRNGKYYDYDGNLLPNS